jgi:hypothetical protein
MNNENNCKHTTFTYERFTTSTGNAAFRELIVIRCEECGTAIGAFPSLLLQTINTLGRGLDVIHEDINELRTKLIGSTNITKKSNR